MCFDLVGYFFLKLSKIDISENLRFLARSFSASCLLACPVESKPNSRMIKTKTIGVMLMASSIIDKKLPRRGCRAEHRATDSRLRTRRKRSSLIPEQLSLSSRYFLKRSKTDISQNVKFLWSIERSSGDPCDAKLFLANNPGQEIRRDKENQWTEHCETNSDARN